MKTTSLCEYEMNSRTRNASRAENSGTLDLTPDHLPVIGRPDGVEGYVVAAGFSGHGFCLGPVVGRVVADLALEREPLVDVTTLSPNRFRTVAA